MFTIKTTQKLLRISGDPAQEMIDSQVMGPEAPEEHLMVLEQDQLEALQMETVVMGQGQKAEQQVAAQAEAVHLMEQDQPGLRAMALDQTVGIPALVLLTDSEAQEMVLVMGLEAVHLMDQGMAQLVAQVLVMETVLTVGIPALVLLTAPEAQTMALEATEEHLMETVVMEQDQLELQEMALEQTVGIPALVLMVVQVQVMGLEVLEEHLMDQGMAQLVAQALVMETVLTVAIPAPVLMVAPEAQATAVTVDQGMVQVQATVTEQATAVTALTTVLSLTLLL